MQMLLLEIKGEASMYKKQEDAKYHNEHEATNPKFSKDLDISILGEIK